MLLLPNPRFDYRIFRDFQIFVKKVTLLCQRGEKKNENAHGLCPPYVFL